MRRGTLFTILLGFAFIATPTLADDPLLSDPRYTYENLTQFVAGQGGNIEKLTAEEYLKFKQQWRTSLETKPNISDPSNPGGQPAIGQPGGTGPTGPPSDETPANPPTPGTPPTDAGGRPRLPGGLTPEQEADFRQATQRQQDRRQENEDFLRRREIQQQREQAPEAPVRHSPVVAGRELGPAPAVPMGVIPGVLALPKYDSPVSTASNVIPPAATRAAAEAVAAPAPERVQITAQLTRNLNSRNVSQAETVVTAEEPEGAIAANRDSVSVSIARRPAGTEEGSGVPTSTPPRTGPGFYAAAKVELGKFERLASNTVETAPTARAASSQGRVLYGIPRGTVRNSTDTMVMASRLNPKSPLVESKGFTASAKKRLRGALTSATARLRKLRGMSLVKNALRLVGVESPEAEDSRIDPTTAMIAGLDPSRPVQRELAGTLPMRDSENSVPWSNLIWATLLTLFLLRRRFSRRETA